MERVGVSMQEGVLTCVQNPDIHDTGGSGHVLVP